MRRPEAGLATAFCCEQLASHFRLVERPADLPFDPAAVGALHYHYQFPRQADGSTVFFWELASNVHQRWQKEGRGPLLELPPDVATRGFALLQAAGVPHGAWFVALHVRDITWKGLNAGMQAIRNADTAAYLPAIAEITSRGGYVVRMGDPDAPPLPPLAECHRLLPQRHAFGLDGYLPDRAKPLHARLGVRPELRSAALWRAGGADQLVAAGHAAVACVGYFHPETAPAVGGRTLSDFRPKRCASRSPIAIRRATSPSTKAFMSKTTIRSSSAAR